MTHAPRQSRPAPSQANSFADPDDAALAIRQLLAEEAASPIEPEPSEPQPEPANDPQPDPAKPSVRRAARISQHVDPVEEVYAPPPARRLFLAVRHHIAAFLHRPDAARILALGVFGVVCVLKPLLVISLVFLSVLTLLVIYVSLGHDRVGEFVTRRYDRLRQADPDRAEALRQRAADGSRRLSRMLDHLPESWTRGIYLPDFEDDHDLPDKAKVDPFERFAAQVQGR